MDYKFNYAEAVLLLRMLPRDQFTPYALLGGGTAVRQQLSTYSRYVPYVMAGAGTEYLLTPRVGLSVGADYHYFLNDTADGVVAGRYNDYYWAGGRCALPGPEAGGEHIKSRAIISKPDKLLLLL